MISDDDDDVNGEYNVIDVYVWHCMYVCICLTLFVCMYVYVWHWMYVCMYMFERLY